MIGAVVVTYNAPAATVAACLRSLFAAGGVDACVLVDNGGRASTPTELADRVEVIATPNRGYGAAVNVGCRRLRELGAGTVAVLNDDVVVRPGWLADAVASLHGDVGVVQPVILEAGREPPVVSSLGVDFDRHGAGIDRGRGSPPPPPGRPLPLDVFTGGAFVASAAYLDATGGFDERWFLYYEDADLALRARELGWEHRLSTGSVVEHVGGVSTSTAAERTHYLQERNRLWFAARHHRPSVAARAVWLSVRRLRHEPRGVHARALVAGVAGMPVRFLERCRARRVSGGSGGRPVPTQHASVD